MPMVLLLLGVVTIVAGLLLAAPGLTIREGSFDIAVITPGVVAVVGGLVLIGLGLAVRVLQRIERVLAARPAAASAAAEPPDAAVRLPFPTRQDSAPQSASAGRASLAQTEDAALERLRVKVPDLTQTANVAVLEGAEGSLLPKAAVPPAQEVGELRSGAVAGRRGNGVSPARVAPRFELKPRGAVASGDRAKVPVLKSVAEVRRAADASVPEGAGPVHGAAAPAAAASSAQEAAVEANRSAAEPPVASVLKSGVVDGMAYTLYADGSIEAQLPQGTLRFGSIAALREHIESAP